MAITLDQPNLLVVEGMDEKNCFEALAKHLKLQTIQVENIGGKNQLRGSLKALAAMPDFAAVINLGVIRDADEDPRAAFQSVRDALSAARLPVPKRPMARVGERPRVNVMILPDENTPGMLEDLCLRSVQSDPAMLCVRQYFECLKQYVPAPRNISKAQVQTFLASRLEVGKRLGEAAIYWPWDNKAFEQLRAFLQQMAV